MVHRAIQWVRSLGVSIHQLLVIYSKSSNISLSLDILTHQRSCPAAEHHHACSSCRRRSMGTRRRRRRDHHRATYNAARPLRQQEGDFNH